MKTHGWPQFVECLLSANAYAISDCMGLGSERTMGPIRISFLRESGRIVLLSARKLLFHRSITVLPRRIETSTLAGKTQVTQYQSLLHSPIGHNSSCTFSNTHCNKAPPPTAESRTQKKGLRPARSSRTMPQRPARTIQLPTRTLAKRKWGQWGAGELDGIA